ncbi:FAD-binding dehydrogenase [Pasteurellaceae bacterium 15-036681]|nr:FAD-binding dehydrogenase [Pasteurellaceae bacterium 15-036681]
MKVKISQIVQADLLVVGSGIGGLSATIEAHDKGIQTLLISKSLIGGGASYFPLKATLGIQVTGDESDKEKFQQDIARVAQGQNNPKIVQAYIEDSPQAIELLDRIGFKPWKRNDNRPACFAQYPRPIYLIKNWREAAQNAKQILAEKRISFYEHATLLYIAVEQNQVQGAVFELKTSDEISYVFCKTSQIILASGGIAGLYKDNLYPPDVIGSVHYVAQQAGAKLINLEFIQFIPSFIEPKYKVLFGEHTLKYVTKVTDSQGNDLFSHLSAEQFQQMMKARSDYAPFSIDFPCVEFDLVMMRHLLNHPQEKGVYLHYSSELYQDKEEFYTVYLAWLKSEVGIDLLEDRIAIAPFAHSCNGGIVIDEFAQSDVKGLFAIGEISSCIEGANRLGGNSVGGSLVFAKRAVMKVLQNLAQKPPLVTTEKSMMKAEDYFNFLDNLNSDKMCSSSQVLAEVRKQMSLFANVYRTEENLYQLKCYLQELEQQYNPLDNLAFQGIEVYHALKAAQCVVEAMLKRKSSLGAHYIE